jgi:hypothetical protein
MGNKANIIALKGRIRVIRRGGFMGLGSGIGEKRGRGVMRNGG